MVGTTVLGTKYGSHMPITAPGNLNTDYYNHKGWYSMLIQGLVDADYYFLMCVYNGLEAVMMVGFLYTLLFTMKLNAFVFCQHDMYSICVWY